LPSHALLDGNTWKQCSLATVGAESPGRDSRQDETQYRIGNTSPYRGFELYGLIVQGDSTMQASFLVRVDIEPVEPEPGQAITAEKLAGWIEDAVHIHVAKHLHVNDENGDADPTVPYCVRINRLRAYPFTLTATTDQAGVSQLAQLIRTVAISCEEALVGTWERNDEGFVAMKEILEDCLQLLGQPLPDYPTGEEDDEDQIGHRHDLT
jgi:hypothetical protein